MNIESQVRAAMVKHLRETAERIERHGIGDGNMSVEEITIDIKDGCDTKLTLILNDREELEQIVKESKAIKEVLIYLTELHEYDLVYEVFSTLREELELGYSKDERDILSNLEDNE